mgnify:CR=1 FL=1
MKKYKDNDSGIALLFTLILVVMFFVLGMAFMSRANFSAKMARNLQESEDARIAANIALENIKSTLKQGVSNNRKTPQLDDYGYTMPLIEARLVNDNNTPSDESDDVVTDSQVFVRSGVNAEFVLTSRPGRFGERGNTNHVARPHYNDYGHITVPPTSGLDVVFMNVVVDPTWKATEDDPRRSGYRYGYFLLSKNGFADINATKQRQNINRGNTFQELNEGESSSTATQIDLYANYDLSKIWEECDHDPATSPIYTFDELYGRIETDGSVTKVTPPSLAGANPNFTRSTSDINLNHHPYRYNTDYDPSTAHGDNGNGADGFHDKEYSYMHATAPYSVSELYPKFDTGGAVTTVVPGTYAPEEGTTTATSFSYERFNLTEITNTTALSVIFAGIPYLNRWKTNTLSTHTTPNAALETAVKLQADTVAANIKDYIDPDIAPTLENYTAGSGVVAANTVIGNERVPYLNEVELTYYHPSDRDSYLNAKVELIWMYGDLPAGGFNGYEVDISMDLEYTKVYYDGITANVAVTETVTMTLIEDDPIVNNLPPEEFKNYYLTKLARINLRTKAVENDVTSGSALVGSAALSFRCDDLKIVKTVMELKDNSGNLLDVASLPATLANNHSSQASTGYTHTTGYQCVDPRNNTHAKTTYWDPETSANVEVSNWALGTYYSNSTGVNGWGRASNMTTSL